MFLNKKLYIINEQSHYTIKQLRDIAKEKKIKYYKTYKKNELEKILGLEISKPNETFEKYCREKMKKPTPIIIINKETGEIFNFKSLYSAAKNFNLNAESIKYRIKAKKDLKINDQTFLVFTE